MSRLSHSHDDTMNALDLKRALENGDEDCIPDSILGIAKTIHNLSDVVLHPHRYSLQQMSDALKLAQKERGAVLCDWCEQECDGHRFKYGPGGVKSYQCDECAEKAE